MTGDTARKKTCCFSGHRPDGLPWKRDESLPAYTLVRQKLMDTVESAIKDGYTHFLTGMAEGIDMMAGEVVLELQKGYPHVSLECAIPYADHGDWIKGEARQRYQYLLDHADVHTIVSKTGGIEALLRRNRYMVDQSSRLIAVYNGSKKGGTKATMGYALKQHLDIFTIHLAQFTEQQQMTLF